MAIGKINVKLDIVIYYAVVIILLCISPIIIFLQKQYFYINHNIK